jgi:hypothetical protein
MAKFIFEMLGAKCYVINVQPNGFNTNICSGTAVVLVVSGPDTSFHQSMHSQGMVFLPESRS